MATYVISYTKNSSDYIFISEDLTEANDLLWSITKDKCEDIEHFTIEDNDDDFDWMDFSANLNAGAFGKRVHFYTEEPEGWVTDELERF